MKKLFALTVILLFAIPSLSSGFYERQKIVLVTGFKPFGNWTANPSEVVANLLNGCEIDNAKIVSIILPVDFNNSFEILKDAIAIYKPSIIISLGLDGMAHKIHVEKIAINLECNEYRCKLIEKHGKFVQISPLPAFKIAEEMRKHGYKAIPSFYAGTYVCNYIFYSTLSYIEENGLQIKAGFIHLPPLKSQRKYGMDADDMANAIKIAIKSVEYQ